MQYAEILYNDVTAAEGLSLTFYVQGCPHHCVGCHNPETWSFEGGKEFTIDILENILTKLNIHNIHRNFCLMGGEPLCNENLILSYTLISEIKEKSPDTLIYIWTGYTIEELRKQNNGKINKILELSDFLVDGPYVEAQRDLTLPLRGSRNQRIINLKFDETQNF